MHGPPDIHVLVQTICRKGVMQESKDISENSSYKPKNRTGHTDDCYWILILQLHTPQSLHIHREVRNNLLYFCCKKWKCGCTAILILNKNSTMDFLIYAHCLALIGKKLSLNCQPWSNTYLPPELCSLIDTTITNQSCGSPAVPWLCLSKPQYCCTHNTEICITSEPLMRLHSHNHIGPNRKNSINDAYN